MKESQRRLKEAVRPTNLCLAGKNGLRPGAERNADSDGSWLNGGACRARLETRKVRSLVGKTEARPSSPPHDPKAHNRLGNAVLVCVKSINPDCGVNQGFQFYERLFVNIGWGGHV
ncbi:MAG: hypothetical protein Q7R47_02800, partial [Candidatus Diapherotrites archaeon]|nr:hypothetical protein [Candidatus Diapherotrites archaeon]